MRDTHVQRDGGARFATLLDDDGNPPCTPTGDCDVCRLFDGRRPGESRAEWLSRITGSIPLRMEEASWVQISRLPDLSHR